MSSPRPTTAATPRRRKVTRLVTVVDDTAPTFTAEAPADKTVNIDPFCGANTSTTIAGMPTVTDAEDNCDSSVDIEIEHTDSAPVYTCDGSDGAAEGSYTFVRTFTITGHGRLRQRDRPDRDAEHHRARRDRTDHHGPPADGHRELHARCRLLRQPHADGEPNGHGHGCL